MITEENAMQVHAVKLDQGWFIKDLPGFEDIRTDVITTPVDLTSSQFHNLDYNRHGRSGVWLPATTKHKSFMITGL